MRISATSDLHGQLPDPRSIDGDVLVIGGDICPDHDQRHWLRYVFPQWVRSLPVSVRRVLATWGNHDFVGLNHPPPVDGVAWLVDSGVTIGGVKFWGSPWSGTFGNWAFMKDEHDLVKRWSLIPNDCHVAILHGPPAGVGDGTIDGVSAGSPSLAARLHALPQLKMAIYGHIHEGAGIYAEGNAIWANVSLLDVKYRYAHAPYTFEVTA